MKMNPQKIRKWYLLPSALTNLGQRLAGMVGLLDDLLLRRRSSAAPSRPAPPDRSRRGSGRPARIIRVKRRSVQANIPRAAARSAAKRTRLIWGRPSYREWVIYAAWRSTKSSSRSWPAPSARGRSSCAATQSAFECGACKLAYLIVDDIPNFILEEAQPLRLSRGPEPSGDRRPRPVFLRSRTRSLTLFGMSNDRRRAPQERRQTDRVAAIFAVKKAIPAPARQRRSSSARPRTSRPPA